MYKDFNYYDSTEVMTKKLEEWIEFSKNKAKSGIHPPWANNKEFKEVCVKDAQAISIIRVYNV